MSRDRAVYEVPVAYTRPILIKDRFHLHVPVSALLPVFPLISCLAILSFGAQQLDQFVKFDLWGHLNEMSDSDPDYIPTPSYLPDQDGSDFDLDTDELCRGADRRLSSPVNFDSLMLEYQTWTPLCTYFLEHSKFNQGPGQALEPQHTTFCQLDELPNLF